MIHGSVPPWLHILSCSCLTVWCCLQVWINGINGINICTLNRQQVWWRLGFYCGTPIYAREIYQFRQDNEVTVCGTRPVSFFFWPQNGLRILPIKLSMSRLAQSLWNQSQLEQDFPNPLQSTGWTHWQITSSFRWQISTGHFCLIPTNPRPFRIARDQQRGHLRWPNTWHTHTHHLVISKVLWQSYHLMSWYILVCIQYTSIYII